MSLSRNILLWMSENKWLGSHIPKMKFVRKAVKKFMPGETENDALNESKKYSAYGIPTVFTKLGENIIYLKDAEAVHNHYLNLIDKIKESTLDIEISIKLTQLGFDLSEEKTHLFISSLADKIKNNLGNTLFIDIEGSSYTQRTIDFYKNAKKENSNVGLCLQAYLYRTDSDLDELIEIDSSIRLVKGAYKEPAEIAYAKKSQVDENFLKLSQKMLQASSKKNLRMIYATHDEKLIQKIIDESKKIGLPKEKLEFQMLYGIKTNFQKKLAADGYSMRTLIAYGESWYPWYVRRLAERPANVLFVLKNLFS